MRSVIETAPRDQTAIVIEDDVRGIKEVARWSPTAMHWIGNNGQPTSITPTHWHPILHKQPLLQIGQTQVGQAPIGQGPIGQTESTNQSRAGFDLLLGRPADAGEITRHPVAPPVDPIRPRRVSRTAIAGSIAAVLIAAATTGVYVGLDDTELTTLYVRLQNSYRSGKFGEQTIQWLSRTPLRTYLPGSEDRAREESAARQLAPVAATPAPEAGPSIRNETDAASLAKAPAGAGRVVDGLDQPSRYDEVPAAPLLRLEHEKIAALMQEVDTARQALESSTAQFRKALGEEHARGDGLADELATVRRDYDAKVELASKADKELAQLRQGKTAAAELEQSLQKERARGDALAGDLAAARRQLDAKVELSSSADKELAQLRLGKTAAAELEQSLQKERVRGDGLADDLAAARRQLDAKVELSSSADKELAQLRQGKTAAAELEQSLQKERARGDALAGDLAAARRELDAKVEIASSANKELAQLRQGKTAAAELEQALQKERDRSASLSNELVTARQDFEKKMASASSAAGEAGRLRELADAKAVELAQSLQRERDRVAALARELESARHPVEVRATPDRTPTGQVAQANQAAQTNQVAQANPTPVPAGPKPAVVEIKGSSDGAARLMARASTLLAQGNIGAARTVLERAVETGSASASFALAETYDPVVLSRWGTYGTRGDPSKARELYEKAMAGGVQGAKDRLNALPR